MDEREPLIRFKQYLLKKNVMSDKDFAALEEEIDSMIEAAIASTEKLAKNEEFNSPLKMFDYLYAEMPKFLQEQRDELAAHLDKEKKLKADAAKQHNPSPAQI